MEEEKLCVLFLQLFENFPTNPPSRQLGNCDGHGELPPRFSESCFPAKQTSCQIEVGSSVNIDDTMSMAMML